MPNTQSINEIQEFDIILYSLTLAIGSYWRVRTYVFKERHNTYLNE